MVLSGSGPSVPLDPTVLRKALEHRKEREAQLLEALDTSPQMPKSLVAKIYTDVDPRMHGLAERSLLSGLRKLEEEGRVQVLPKLCWAAPAFADGRIFLRNNDGKAVCLDVNP